jgi:hypothetical protein
MSAGNLIVVVVGVAAAAIVVLWFLLGRQHPEEASSHGEAARTGSALHHGDVDDRPAGPGAEAQGVAAPGEPIPGPSPTGEQPPR